MEIGLGRICYISKYLPQSKSVTLLKGYWWWWPLKEKINQISPSLPHCQYFNYLNYLKYYKCHLSCHNVDGRWSWQSSKGKWSEEIQSLISHLPQSPFTAIIQDLSTVSQNEHLHFSHGVFCNLSPFKIFHCFDLCTRGMFYPKFLNVHSNLLRINESFLRGNRGCAASSGCKVIYKTLYIARSW